MKQEIFTIYSNEEIAPGLWKMVLEGDTGEITNSGQFVNVQLPGLYLRRPVSVSDRTGDTLTLVYKVVGKGTAMMAEMRRGGKLDILTGLGNGFDCNAPSDKVLLAGGGVGTAPLYLLAKELLAGGRKVTVALGFNTASEIMLKDEFQRLGTEVLIATMDGSEGTKGFVTDAVRENGTEFGYFYACGPKPMLKALCGAFTQDGEVSMEERMGCGFGICYGCTINTTGGPRRVCKDGPVFKKEEIIW